MQVFCLFYSCFYKEGKKKTQDKKRGGIRRRGLRGVGESGGGGRGNKKPQKKSLAVKYTYK